MNSCVFCNILSGTDPQSERLIYRDERWAALVVLHPETYGHFIVFPITHYSTLNEMGEELGALIMKTHALAERAIFALRASAYYLKVNNNVFRLEKANPRHVGHVHMHVVPRYSTSDTFAVDSPEELESYFEKVLRSLKG
jgi:histidine triad (HIT) family protein